MRATSILCCSRNVINTLFSPSLPPLSSSPLHGAATSSTQSYNGMWIGKKESKKVIIIVVNFISVAIEPPSLCHTAMNWRARETRRNQIREIKKKKSKSFVNSFHFYFFLFLLLFRLHHRHPSCCGRTSCCVLISCAEPPFFSPFLMKVSSWFVFFTLSDVNVSPCSTRTTTLSIKRQPSRPVHPPNAHSTQSFSSHSNDVISSTRQSA